MPEDEIPVERRRLIFHALIEAQDGGMAVAVSRKRIAEAHGLSLDQVKLIEREGIDGHWPPL